ncbi:DUF3823 domain-containing protein [Chitinophaga sp. SYP-B3965]|uniref:DUF3823 domain-containing protein n=1 Tax=Chitinophaga sp. SYP-B3965 TaxID=2663120 RepID=UPI001299D249|nr:DUF3823 domain-containing protein [Chitinophaga sp. SYP-B3965]MRG44514.1 DUF3823 domain-containing protein [Chitinophaga sp. SYP-B3965]
MKRIQLYAVAVSMLLASSCSKLDNYGAPDSALYGSILDIKTNELVEQDIINGTQIEFLEQGYENPISQYMVIKNDGTYRNNLVFSGAYDIRPVRGNCLPIDMQRIQVKGSTQLDFKVQPYIRVQNVSIQKIGTKVVATFNLEQTVAGKVKKIGLYAHPEPIVGEPVRTVAAEQQINTTTNINTVYRLEIDLPANASLKPGKEYFFRVGALIDVPEMKPNYAKAVRIVI